MKYFLTLAIILGLAPLTFGQPYRDNLPLSQVEIFQRMFSQAEEEGFDKIQKGAIFLEPLFSAIQTKMGVGIKGEIEKGIVQKDKTRVLAALGQLVYLDMIDLLSIGGDLLKENNIDKAKSKIKIAYADYLLISPSISAKSFPTDQKVKNSFRLLSLGVGTTLKTEDYHRMTKEIQQDIVSVQPEYKNK